MYTDTLQNLEKDLETLNKIVDDGKSVTVTLSKSDIAFLHSAILNAKIVLKARLNNEVTDETSEVYADYISDADSLIRSLKLKVNEETMATV